MVNIVMNIVGVIEKLFMSKLSTTSLSKNFNICCKQEMISYSEVENSPCPKIASKYSLGEKTQIKRVVV